MSKKPRQKLPQRPRPILPPAPQFSACTTRYQGRVNRIITDINLTPPFDADQYKGKPLPYNLLKKRALWDTGATNSVITTTTAQELNLAPVGIVDVVHAGGSKQCNTYLVNLFLPNMVAICGVMVTGNSDLLHSDFDVIVGMDIIAAGDFAITNVDGLTCMSYRFPSIATVDYVWEVERIRYAGADKYGPCPCGKKDENGKPVKFKFCHGRTL